MDNNVFKETLNFSRIIYEYVVVVLVKMNLRGGLSTRPLVLSRVSKKRPQSQSMVCWIPKGNNYLLYEGESKCGGIKLPKCTKCFTLGTSGFNLKPELSEAKRGL